MKTNFKTYVIFLGLIIFIFMSDNSRAQLNWEKYENNPVMQVQAGTWYAWNVFYPVVIHEDGIFKMWFCGSNNSAARHIGYASSDDGIEWEILNNPVISSGEPGPWALHLYPGAVLRINDTLRMWFVGSSNSVNDGSIGYAWSVEEHIWNTYPEPVLEAGEEGTWDDIVVFHPSVYYDGTIYHMYHMGADETWQMGYATSFDGINWEKDYNHSPVIQVGPPESFYNAGIISGHPIMYRDTLRMYFAGSDGTSSYPPHYSFWRIGYAWSTDYVTWNIHPDPVLDVGESGAWDESIVAGPTVLIHDGFFRMWYWGDHYNASWEIGYAIGDPVVIPNLSEQINSNLDVINVYPCPITDKVTISYRLKEKSMVEIDIYNYYGQQIFTLVSEVKVQGKHEVLFEGKGLQPGIYFCALKTNPAHAGQTIKMIKL